MLVTPVGSYLEEKEIKFRDTINEIIRCNCSSLCVHDVPVVLSRLGIAWDYYDIDIEVYENKVVFKSDTDPSITVTFYKLHRPIKISYSDGRSNTNATVIKSCDGYISVLKGLDVV